MVILQRNTHHQLIFTVSVDLTSPTLLLAMGEGPFEPLFDVGDDAA
jgi:type VI protein secretion system component Hcp